MERIQNVALTAALASDALDELGLRGQALADPPVPLRPGMRLEGPAMTAIIAVSDEIEDPPYEGEIGFLDSFEAGSIGVYQVDPAVRAAIWGELFSCAAAGRGAAGVLVDGPIRDASGIADLGFPVFHRGTSPLDTRGRAVLAASGVPVVIGGVVIRPGDWIVADEDGVVAVPAEALADCRAVLEPRLRGETGARGDLLAGKSLSEVWDTWRVL